MVVSDTTPIHTELPEYVSVQPLEDSGRRLPGTENLGRGEAEAVQLAKEEGAEILLTDDRKARTVATTLGVKCMGLLGVVVPSVSNRRPRRNLFLNSG